MNDFITIKPVKTNINIQEYKKTYCINTREFFRKEPTLARICSVAFAQKLPCVLGSELYMVKGDSVCIYLKKSQDTS